MSVKIKIWDAAVRVFHWSQVVLLAGLWYTGTEGLMAWHQLLAYTLAALLIARIAWGFYGSSNARFSQFLSSPKTAWRYLRKPTPVAGHNPAGSFMIFALILLLCVQLLSGLATFDNSYINDGPLVAYLSDAWVSLASSVHKTTIDIILIAVGVHVLAALWHSIRHDNVILSMLSGKSTAVTAAQAPRLVNSWSFFAVTAVLLAVFYLWQGKMLLSFI